MNKVFKALADKTRRRIVRLLRDGNMNAGDIAEHFDLSKPSISHHLNVLKSAELVLSERRGQEIIYSLNTTVMQEFLTEMLEYFGGEDYGN